MMLRANEEEKKQVLKLLEEYFENGNNIQTNKATLRASPDLVFCN